ncbi:hypothetical protein CFP56_001611 [Quercus suber]|uniref:Uncharacterized protein n=1 Tax=Quercus suber TaxID=58331 RepID=A0AAW0LGN8_QUESU
MKLAVIGEDVDSAKLTCLLEKKEKLDDEKPESLNLQLHQVIHHFTVYYVHSIALEIGVVLDYNSC